MEMGRGASTTRTLGCYSNHVIPTLAAIFFLFVFSKQPCKCCMSLQTCFLFKAKASPCSLTCTHSLLGLMRKETHLLRIFLNSRTPLRNHFTCDLRVVRYYNWTVDNLGVCLINAGVRADVDE